MIDGIPIGDLTAPTLVGLAVLMVFLGLLVPRRFYRAKEEECERWHSAFEVQRDRANKSDEQVNEMLEVSKTTHAIVVALFDSRVSGKRSGDSNVAS